LVFKVEQDLQRAWREEREKQLQLDVERNSEDVRVKPIPFWV
jgi:hypothetical protein